MNEKEREAKEESGELVYCYACFQEIDRTKPHYAIAETKETLDSKSEVINVIGEAVYIGFRHVKCHNKLSNGKNDTRNF